MKSKTTQIIIVLLVLSIGVVIGVLLQKFYPVGYILKSIGVSYSLNSTPEPTQEIVTDIPNPTPTATPRVRGIPEEFIGTVQLFILAGQSNMSGAGELPKNAEEENYRIYVFGNDYAWKLAAEPIDDPTDQVDRVSRDKKAGYSPALSFARSLLEQRPDIVIGLIPCAKGASSIDEWRRSLNDNTLYGSCLKRIRAASVMGDVAGILFLQGETDAAAPEAYPDKVLLPNQWGKEFIELVDTWRTDLDLPDLPVIYAQIGADLDPEEFINWEIVKEQQLGVQVPISAMIKTDDLAMPNHPHFTTKGYIEIGKRFAEAYLTLIEGDDSD
jgi:hypothetical protein